MILLLGLGLTGTSVYLLVRVFYQEEETTQSGDALLLDAVDGESATKRKESIFLKYSRPFYRRYVLPLVEDSVRFKDLRKILKRKLISAGMLKEMTPDELISYKSFLVVGFPILYLVLRWLIEEDWSLGFIPVVALFGWFYPDRVWLSSKIKKRQNEIRRAMPFVVDLLALTIEAGLDFMGAVARVVEKAKPSPLVEELDQLQREVRVGSSRKEALRNLSNRIDMTEINSFVAIIVAAEETGGSIGKVLKQQSEEIRIDRMARAEKEGAKATQKIMIPLFLFFLPAVLILMAIPLALQFMGGQ